MMKLTPELLRHEYLHWINENGVGRNRLDQRFGQYLINNFVIGEYRTNIVVFYQERADRVYDMVLEELRAER